MTEGIGKGNEGQCDGADGHSRTTDQAWYQAVWRVVKPGFVAVAATAFITWIICMVIGL
jgi:hypothetical protein